MVELIKVQDVDKKTLWNIFQKYLYEMTNYYVDEIDKEGNYPYEYFDAYFTQASRKAFFVYDGRVLVGFAMINTYSYIGEKDDNVLAEFTIFPAYRRRHIATKAVTQIFNLYSGRWEVKYNEKNGAAKSFWHKVTAQYDPKVFCIDDGETVLSFLTK